jgi:hypothetical protein
VTERGAICRGGGKGPLRSNCEVLQLDRQVRRCGMYLQSYVARTRPSPPSMAARATDQEHLGLLLVCFSLMATRLNDF